MRQAKHAATKIVNAQLDKAFSNLPLPQSIHVPVWGKLGGMFLAQGILTQWAASKVSPNSNTHPVNIYW